MYINRYRWTEQCRGVLPFIKRHPHSQPVRAPLECTAPQSGARCVRGLLYGTSV
ncbi:unnamed protein product [Staurois parvus]|uniref:Uncharacterized protein n=1 Tax=Staurois parvus TaxID=386267 RepID=A0ABN9H5K1_9NEOB|nr:unnamed protein product [Staurois parvus]